MQYKVFIKMRKSAFEMKKDTTKEGEQRKKECKVGNIKPQSIMSARFAKKHHQPLQ